MHRVTGIAKQVELGHSRYSQIYSHRDQFCVANKAGLTEARMARWQEAWEKRKVQRDREKAENEARRKEEHDFMTGMPGSGFSAAERDRKSPFMVYSFPRSGTT